MTARPRIRFFMAFLVLFAGTAFAWDNLADDDLAALRSQAESGSAQAQFDLGVRYQQGKGVDRDPAMAVGWFRKAAEQGLPMAQLQLGLSHLSGNGVPKDPAKGVEWCRRAAENGWSLAQYLLGLILHGGDRETIGASPDEALKWMRKAADQGIPEAQFTLFILTLREDDKAISWLQKSAEQGFVPARLTLSTIQLEAPETEEDLRAGMKTAIACLEGPAGNKEPSMLPLLDSILEGYQKQVHHVEGLIALNYYLGKGVEVNAKEAFRWATRSVEGGCDEKKPLLAALYFNGEGVEQNYAKALELFLPTADQGNAKAQLAVGEIYYKGSGQVARDNRTALAYFRKSAAQGQAMAMLRAGQILLEGGEPGVTKDVTEGLRLIREAAEKGLKDAQFAYGMSLLGVHETEKNRGEARGWLLKAAEQGDVPAMINLAAIALGATGSPFDGKSAEEWLRKALATDPRQVDIYYNMACLRSLQKRPEEALDWLRQALEKGYRNERGIQEDPDLEGVRAYPGFIALMEKYFPKNH